MKIVYKDRTTGKVLSRVDVGLNTATLTVQAETVRIENITYDVLDKMLVNPDKDGEDRYYQILVTKYR